MKKLNLTPIAAVTVGFLSVGAHAQATKTVATLPAITVTADRVDGYVAPVSSMATKTDTPIENIPQTVVVVPRQVIEDQGATKLSDVTTNVSNVQHFDQRDFSTVTSFKIRGFNAAVVVDGVASPGYFSNLEPVYNMEQVDVVKGPGGALYATSQSTGADSVGGMIGITTKAPGPDARRQVGFRVGSYNDRAYFADLNQPINETLGVRLVVQKQSADSETDRVSSKQTFIAPSLALNIDRDRKFVLRFKHVENDWRDSVGLPTQTAARNGNLTAEGIPKSTMKADSINAHYTQRLNDSWKFDFVVAETRAKFDQRAMFYLSPNSDAPNAAPGGESARLWQDMKTTVISPTLTSKFDTGSAKHTLLLGAEEVKTRDNGYVAVNLADTGIPDGFGGTLNAVTACMFGISCTYTSYSGPYAAWVEPTSPTDPYNKVSSTTHALYAQDQIDLGRWHFQAGLRYARMKINDYYTGGTFFGGSDPAGLTAGHDDKDTFSKLLPRVGAVFDITDNASMFVGYGEGTKVPLGGRYDPSAKRKPEESNQTEIGFRLKDWYGLTATLAWFDLTRRNVPTSGPAPNYYIYQVGEQNSKGIDLNLAWKASKSLTVLAGLSDQKAITVENQYSAASVGKLLQNVPAQTARLAMRYDLREGDLAGLGFGLGLRHHSKLAADSSNTNFTPAVTVYDSQVSYRMKGVSLNLAINNLLDKKYVVPSSQSSSAGPLYFPAPGRTAMLTATMDF
jgi:iron complex outermembrane receptor protein